MRSMPTKLWSHHSLGLRLCTVVGFFGVPMLLRQNISTSLVASSADMPDMILEVPISEVKAKLGSQGSGQLLYDINLQNSDNVAAPESASEKLQSLEARGINPSNKSQRIDFYRQHYGYVSPSPRTENHPNCKRHPSGDWEWFGLSPKERSRGNEDRTIYEWFFKDFPSTERGTYLELGAFNGVSESNSRFFDECLGWEGLLIEANPKMKDSVLKARPHPHKLFFAASCPIEDLNETIRFVQASSNAHVARSDKAKKDRRSVDVGCGPLSPVIETLLLNSHINFFSLDVEGAEAQVLRTINWTRVKVDVMIAESINNHCQQVCEHRSEVRQIMKEAGYLLYVDGVFRSDLFVHPSMKTRPPAKYLDGYTDVMQSEFEEAWPLHRSTG